LIKKNTQKCRVITNKVVKCLFQLVFSCVMQKYKMKQMST
jgi:hypothetical protein